MRMSRSRSPSREKKLLLNGPLSSSVENSDGKAAIRIVAADGGFDISVDESGVHREHLQVLHFCVMFGLHNSMNICS